MDEVKGWREGWTVLKKHLELPNKTRDEVREAVVLAGLEFLHQTAVRLRAIEAANDLALAV